jgi:hypothetical protein
MKLVAEPIVTDPEFAETFDLWGMFTIIMKIVMFIFYHKLYRMINKTTDVAIAPKKKDLA